MNVAAAFALERMSLVCPHEHAAVRWVDKEHRFQCTKHDSRYQPDGLYTSGRATRNLDRFQSDKDPSGWAAAVVAV